MSVLLSLLMAFSLLGSGPEKAPADSAEGNFHVRNLSLFTESDQLYFSIDRLSYRSYNRITGYDGARPLVLLNGLPVDAHFFGNLNPQYIPSAGGQIQRAENHEGFGYAGAIPYRSGVISLESEELPAGLSAYGSTQISNEAGEPGPWVYDPERVTPNVERFGPGTDVSVNYRADDFYLKSLYRYHRHLNTDLAVQRRMRTVVSVPGGDFEPSIGVNQLGMIEAGSSTKKVEFIARAVYGESDEFIFFRPLGREVPVQKNLSGVTLAGNAEINENWMLNMLFISGRKEFDYRVNRFDYNFDLHQNNLEILTTLNRETNRGSLMAGISRESNTYDAPGLLQYRTREWSLLGSFQRELSEGIRFTAKSQTAFEEEIFVTASAGIDADLSDAWQIRAEAGIIELNTRFSGNYNHLVLQGYTIFDQLNIDAEMPEEIDKEQMLTFSVEQNIGLSESLELETEAAITSHRSFHIPFQPVEYDELMHTMPGTYRLITGQTGNRLDLSGAINYSAGRMFDTRLFAGYNRTLNGTDSYRSYWKMIPQWQVRYSAGFKPYPDLELRASAWYRSSTQWDEFEGIDGEQFWTANPRYPPTFGTFHSRVPAHLQINAKAAKWFWEQRVRAVIMTKNITNRKFYSHPIGVREGFTFVLRAELRF